MNLRIQLPLDANRYEWLRMTVVVSGYAPVTNTGTDSANATYGPYVSILSIRNKSVNASAEPGSLRIVSARSEGPAYKILKVSKI